MKTIIFNNPPKDLFVTLKKIGLVNFFQMGEPSSFHLQGKSFSDSVISGISEKPCWGDNREYHKLTTSQNNAKHFDYETKSWKIASVSLSEKGIEILKKSSVKNWEVV